MVLCSKLPKKKPIFQLNLSGVCQIYASPQCSIKGTRWRHGVFCMAWHKIAAECLQGLRLFMHLHVGARGPPVKPLSFPFLFFFLSAITTSRFSRIPQWQWSKDGEKAGAGWGGLAGVRLGGGAVLHWLNLILLSFSWKKKSHNSPSPLSKLLSSSSQAIKAAMHGILFFFLSFQKICRLSSTYSVALMFRLGFWFFWHFSNKIAVKFIPRSKTTVILSGVNWKHVSHKLLLPSSLSFITASETYFGLAEFVKYTKQTNNLIVTEWVHKFTKMLKIKKNMFLNQLLSLQKNTNKKNSATIKCCIKLKVRTDVTDQKILYLRISSELHSWTRLSSGQLKKDLWRP